MHSLLAFAVRSPFSAMEFSPDPHGRGPSVAAVLLVRLLFDLQEWDAAGRPLDRVPQLWAEVVDLDWRYRASGPYAPPARGARRLLVRAVNRVNWLLLRAFAPADQYRPLSDLSLRGDYALPEFVFAGPDRSVAMRAVRFSWLRRLLASLRWLYSRLSDVDQFPSISEVSLRPSVEAMLGSFRPYTSVLPRDPPPVFEPGAFAEVSRALARDGPFAV